MNDWKSLGRIVLKAALLFLLFNLIFAVFLPLEPLGQLSLYNWLLQGRDRLPYGENTADSYNLNLYNIPAMFASHTISQPKTDDEFRVILLGDSGTWGWFLDNDDTLAGQLNQMDLTTPDGKEIVVYNLGYPVMSLTKDILLLDEARNYDPDLIIWPITLESFPPDKQLVHPIVQNNPERLRPLLATYNLAIDPNDERFVDPQGLARTIVGQRRNLADLLRLQQVGFSWTATGIDQAIPLEIPLRKSDFDEDTSWQNYDEPTTLTTKDLAFDVLQAGMEMSGDVPVLLINEPMFISDGQNSDLRYNSFYPRWVYDQYRTLLAATAVAHNWHYIDLWNAIPPDEFTDTPVHLTPVGAKQFANLISNAVTSTPNTDY